MQSSWRKENREPCHSFQNGHCHFGQNCRYSHATPGIESHGQPLQSNTNGVATTQNGDNLSDVSERWKKLLPRPNSAPVLSLGVKLETFFKNALVLIGGDAGNRQDTIKKLGSDEGLARIKELAAHHIPSASTYQARAQVWKQKMHPFFLTITYPKVANSAILETPLQNIFNFLVGPNGERLALIYDFVNTLGSEWIIEDQADGVAKAEFLHICTTVLSGLVDCNTHVMINDSIPPLVDRLQKLVSELDKEYQLYHQTMANRTLERVFQRLKLGKDLPIDASHKRPIPMGPSPMFVLAKDLPGILSRDGPRHDNDMVNIWDIQILPTIDEIRSPRAEYRPVNDPAELHLPGLQGLVDRHFRLLREDTIGQLRDVVRAHLQTAATGKEIFKEKQKLRTFCYNVEAFDSINFLDSQSQKGFEFHLKIEQVCTRVTVEDRENWWKFSRRLEREALVCLLGSDSVVFCVVSDTTIRCYEECRQRDARGRLRCTATLFGQPDAAHVALQLAQPNDKDREILFNAFKAGPGGWRLVEFPRIILASFKPTLQALQVMGKSLDVPFKEYLAPTTSSDGGTVIDVPPPDYALAPGFSFNLQCLTGDDQDLFFSPQDVPDHSELCARSSLDGGQGIALLNALKRRFALIQGPPFPDINDANLCIVSETTRLYSLNSPASWFPTTLRNISQKREVADLDIEYWLTSSRGTGKSYTGESIIKVLLESKNDSVILGPILCVCETNHALDQLLEHLLDRGVKQIIRIGSKSKSARLEKSNIKIIAKSKERTRSEKSITQNEILDLRRIAQLIRSTLKQLKSVDTAESMKGFLAEEYREYHDAIFGVGEDGWDVSHEDLEASLGEWLSIPKAQTGEAEDATVVDKHAMLIRWCQELTEKLSDDIIRLNEEYEASNRRLEDVNKEIRLRCLQQANVIGVTTTGLARALDLLTKVQCKVVVCEEAAEVLESHILTALLPSVEHAILIGDHLQLRPHIENWDLNVDNFRGEQFSLNVSLFERLVAPQRRGEMKMPFDTLDVQRRMHPSISNLIRSTIYPNLKDEMRVQNYPQVAGMRKRLYWFDHKHAEHLDQEQLSHTAPVNYFEVDMVKRILSHLVRQGKYKTGDIAVLTPYLGQLRKLRQKLEDSFEIVLGERDISDLEKEEGMVNTDSVPYKKRLGQCLRIASVDNFQGEEASVVIISLVRSNRDRNCGFLKSENRINVLLSRAKHGMFIVGNSDTYANSDVWPKVIDILKTEGNFGTSLPLQCPRHPDTELTVSDPIEFAQVSPEGGCNRRCDQPLDCGHNCKSSCHSDVLHQAVVCLEHCERIKESCGHACPKRCGEPCETQCSTVIHGAVVVLPWCGHEFTSPRCWQIEDPAEIDCKEIARRVVPGCSHSIEVACSKNITADTFKCPAECGSLLPCGHPCQQPCNSCKTRKGDKVVREIHGKCRAICGRKYENCQHSCTQPCHPGEDCKPCQKPCEVRCSHMHSRCTEKCSEPCLPCAEDTGLSCCPHSKCSLPCTAPCDWVPCSERCTTVLGCGHQCPSLCGERCPEQVFCQTCATSEIASMTVDPLKCKKYHEVDLDLEPCIFPDCHHIMTVTSMDTELGMRDHYNISEHGKIEGIKTSPELFSDTEIKSCPTCRGSLRNISRYGRVVRQAILDSPTKEFIRSSYRQLDSLESSLIEEQKRLKSSMYVSRIIRDLETRAAQPSNQSRFELVGNRENMLQAIDQGVNCMHYACIINLRMEIQNYLDKIKVQELPYRLVYDLVKYAPRNKQVPNKSSPEQLSIQVRPQLGATILLLRCDLIILADFLRMRAQSNLQSQSDVTLNVVPIMADCQRVLELAKKHQYRRHEAEAQICHARLMVMQRSVRPFVPQTKPDGSKTFDTQSVFGLQCLSAAEKLVSNHPFLEHLRPVIANVRSSLADQTFHAEVSAEENRGVWNSLCGKLQGTVHWYTCENCHPFMVDDCDQKINCPECGAPGLSI